MGENNKMTKPLTITIENHDLTITDVEELKKDLSQLFNVDLNPVITSNKVVFK